MPLYHLYLALSLSFLVAAIVAIFRYRRDRFVFSQFENQDFGYIGVGILIGDEEDENSAVFFSNAAIAREKRTGHQSHPMHVDKRHLLRDKILIASLFLIAIGMAMVWVSAAMPVYVAAAL